MELIGCLVLPAILIGGLGGYHLIKRAPDIASRLFGSDSRFAPRAAAMAATLAIVYVAVSNVTVVPCGEVQAAAISCDCLRD